MLRHLKNITVQCVLQTEESISGLAAMVKELQEYFSEEKRRGIILKQEEIEQKEQHWNGEISQINQVTITSSRRTDRTLRRTANGDMYLN